MSAPSPKDPGAPVVLLAGNPNSGKTTLFNALTGSRARTGNYPGVTVERRVGSWRLDPELSVELVDLPGAYSLTARSREEAVAIDALLARGKGGSPGAIVVVADSSNLERHLYFAVQLFEVGLPTVLALNFADEARRNGITIDARRIAERAGIEVVPIAARSGEGLPELALALKRAIRTREIPRNIELDLPSALAEKLADVEAAFRELESPRHRRVRAALAILSRGSEEDLGTSAAVRQAVERAFDEATKAGLRLDEAIIAARYRHVDALLDGAITRAPRGVALTARIDAVLTHPVLGLVTFLVVMAALFQALFTWSEPLIGGIENAVALAQSGVRAILPAGPLSALLSDGVVAGAGNVVVFVPQIAILSLFLIVLEDSGYLARVALVIDRLMGAVGLHGRAFVPLLSGFACAVPAVIATRTIENRRDRLLTMLALPLMSCSARLPVYTLVVAVALPAGGNFHGLSHGAIALFGMYLLSVVASLGAAAVMRRTVLSGPRPTMILELPPYRLPVFRNLLRSTWERVWQFLSNAGTLIVAITIVLWALLHLPGDEAAVHRHDEALASASATLTGAALEDRRAELSGELAEAQMENSIGGTIGRAIEPVIAPLGFDWKIGVGLLASFAAREVLVSTLGIVYGVGDEADESSEPLRARLRAARRPDGTPVFTPLVGLSLMVFFVLAAQCMSTLAIVRRESGSWRWAMFMLVYMNVLAYVGSLIVYQGGRALGFV